MYIYNNKNKTQVPTLLETQAQKVFMTVKTPLMNTVNHRVSMPASDYVS